MEISVTATTALLTLVVAPLLAGDAPAAPAAQELRYNGSLSSLNRDGEATPVKEFTVYCLLAPTAQGQRDLAFLVDERGGGGWAWPERFGKVTLDASNKAGGTGPQVLHDDDGTMHPLPVPQAVLEQPDKLAANASWTLGNQQYHVRGKKKTGGHDCWQVDVIADTRPLQTLFVDSATGVVVSAERRVFMGRGDQFALKIDLDSVKDLSAAEYEQVQKPIATLLKLKEQLQRPEDETQPELNESQIESAAGFLDQLDKETAQTPFARLAAVISRDVKAQRDRTKNVAGLADKFVGKDAPQFELKHLDGKPVDRQQYNGKIVVLHFWKYHDEPLVEPYGQVGYLDFLHSRRGKLGVQVFGVAVDERFGKPEQRSAAIRQTRGFKDFMNVGYPITGDDGSLLTQFGDPRKLGAKLPLWIVIDPDGKVAHYHAGFYSLKPDEGLNQLDGVVAELLKKQPAAAAP